MQWAVGNRLAWFGTAALFGLIGGVAAQLLIAPALATGKGDPPPPQKLVRALAFELADPADPNKPLAVLRRGSGGGGELQIGNSAGMPVITLGVDKGSGRLVIQDARGDKVLWKAP